MDDSRGEITRLVGRWSAGEEGAFDRLIEEVYDDLRRIAHHHLELGARGGTIDTTVLVHEAYLRLAEVDEGAWRGRAEFFAFCSKAMRHILVDYARRRNAAKRGGSRVRVPLRADVAAVDPEDLAELIALDDALERLEANSPRMARIVECRFFGGMSVSETAEALATSTRTVEREWARARAYLHQSLTAGEPSSGDVDGGTGNERDADDG